MHPLGTRLPAYLSSNTDETVHSHSDSYSPVHNPLLSSSFPTLPRPIPHNRTQHHTTQHNTTRHQKHQNHHPTMGCIPSTPHPPSLPPNASTVPADTTPSDHPSAPKPAGFDDEYRKRNMRLAYTGYSGGFVGGGGGDGGGGG